MLRLREVQLLIGNKTDVCRYSEMVLNSTLSDEADSLKSSFSILESSSNDGLMVIFPQPSVLIYDQDTYFKIYEILSTALWPQFTLPRPASMRLVPVDGKTITMSRAFFYPFVIGSPSRLVGTAEQIVTSFNPNRGIKLMNGITVGPKCRTFALCGNTGSGKTDGATYINECFRRTTSVTGKPATVIFIDGKNSSGARWAKMHPDVELIAPKYGERQEDFLVRVTERLAKVIDDMRLTQDKLFNSTDKISTDANSINKEPTWVTISEFEAITIDASSKLTKILMRQLELIALLGRESLTGFCLDLQVARNDVLPVPIRSQIGCRILLGRIDSSTTVYFFPDLGNIVMPYSGPGTGIIDINDGNHTGVMPIPLPTLTDWS